MFITSCERALEEDEEILKKKKKKLAFRTAMMMKQFMPTKEKFVTVNFEIMIKFDEKSKF